MLYFFMKKKEPKKVWIANVWGGKKVSLGSMSKKRVISPFWKVMTVLLYFVFLLLWGGMVVFSSAGIFIKVILIIFIVAFFGLGLWRWVFIR